MLLACYNFAMKDYLIDTHAHIDMLENPELGIIEAREAGVKEIIIPSASVKDKIRRIHSAYGLTTHSRQASSLLDEFTEPKILTVLSHKPVQSKKKKKFTYNDFDENFTKEKVLEKETQQNVIALRGKALLFRQKLKKQGANKGA